MAVSGAGVSTGAPRRVTAGQPIKNDNGVMYPHAKNPRKQCFLSIGPYEHSDPNLFPKAGDNWRTQNPAGIEVDKKIELVLDNYSFNLAVKNNYSDFSLETALKNVSSNLTENTSIKKGLGYIDSAAAFTDLTFTDSNNNKVSIGNTRNIPKYNNMKTWNGSDPLVIRELKFKFFFGMGAHFSGLEEVVKPVLALASCFTPQKIQGGRIGGPIPTPEYATAMLVRQAGSNVIDLLNNVSLDKIQGVMGSAFDAVSDKIKEAGAAAKNIKISEAVTDFKQNGEQIIKSAVDLKSKLYQAYDNLMGTLLSEPETKVAVLKIGDNFIMGPVFVEEVDYNFNYTNVDSDGYPTQGDVTLKNLTYPFTPTADTLKVVKFKSN